MLSHLLNHGLVFWDAVEFVEITVVGTGDAEIKKADIVPLFVTVNISRSIQV